MNGKRNHAYHIMSLLATAGAEKLFVAKDAMPTSTSKRLSDKAKPWIIEALKQDHAVFNEVIIWDTSVAVFPDSAAASVPNDASTDLSAVVPLPTFVIYLEIPGSTPETPLYIAPILPPFNLTKETVTTVINDSLKRARAYRDAIKADSEKPQSDENVSLDNLTAN